MKNKIILDDDDCNILMEYCTDEGYGAEVIITEEISNKLKCKIILTDFIFGFGYNNCDVKHDSDSFDVEFYIKNKTFKYIMNTHSNLMRGIEPQHLELIKL